MKRILASLAFVCLSALADTPTAEQVQYMLEHDQLDVAEVALKQVLADRPNSAKAHLMLAYLDLKRGHPGDAVAKLSKVDALDTKHQLTSHPFYGEIARAGNSRQTSFSWFIALMGALLTVALVFIGKTFYSRKRPPSDWRDGQKWPSTPEGPAPISPEIRRPTEYPATRPTTPLRSLDSIRQTPSALMSQPALNGPQRGSDVSDVLLPMATGALLTAAVLHSSRSEAAPSPESWRASHPQRALDSSDEAVSTTTVRESSASSDSWSDTPATSVQRSFISSVSNDGWSDPSPSGSIDVSSPNSGW